MEKLGLPEKKRSGVESLGAPDAVAPLSSASKSQASSASSASSASPASPADPADQAEPIASITINLALAEFCSVFNPRDVEKALLDLPEDAPRSLRQTYERMLSTGPSRFAVKPKGIPALSEAYGQMPNFSKALDSVKAQVSLSQSQGAGLDIEPILLLGAPGVGKTHFGKTVANALQTEFKFVPMGSLTAGWILSGASSQWKHARPGKVFLAIINGQVANPVVLLDEIDKAGKSSEYDPLGALYELLEPSTAKNFVDEFTEIPIDASRIVWIATANEESSIPSPLLSRMRVHEIKAPTPDEALSIARQIHAQIRSEKAWGKDFEEDLIPEVMDLLSKMPPREMKKALMSAFGQASLEKRQRLDARDFPESQGSRGRLGF